MDSDQNTGIMCSWCTRIKDKELGWVFQAVQDDHPLAGPLTSHGLCDKCYVSIIDNFLHISKQPTNAE